MVRNQMCYQHAINIYREANLVDKELLCKVGEGEKKWCLAMRCFTSLFTGLYYDMKRRYI